MSIHEGLAEWSSWGWSLAVNHLWQATLACGVALAAVALMRRGPARARYAVWLIALLKFAVPSFVIIILANLLGMDFSTLLDSTADQAPGVMSQIAVIELPAREVASGTAVVGHNEIYCALTIVWLTGCAVVAGVWCKRRFEFSLALRAGESVSRGREWEALERVRGWLAIRRRVRLCISPRILEPGAWRTLRPVIVLPDQMGDHLSEAELEAVLMHEMVHIARWDNLVSNLQMALCCVFWFHPLVWLIDRRVLAERERACDDRVIELGGVSKVYALSLLKVLRFCLGTKMAGVSYATGSNLRRRVERIMSSDIDRKLKVPHRVLIMATAAVVIVFSIAAGLLSGEGTAAQTGQTTKAGSVYVADRMPGGAVVEVLAEPSSSGEAAAQKVDDLAARIEQAPETIISFENKDEAPLIITDARVKAVLHGKLYHKADSSWSPVEDVYMFKPSVMLINNTGKRITGFSLYFINKESKHKIHTEHMKIGIEPYGSYSFGNIGRNFLSLPGDPGSLSVELLAVHFEDGSHWHSSTLPPPPPVRIEMGAPPPPPPPVAEAPPAPPPPPVVISGNAVRKSGDVLQQTAIRRVQPSYPALAKAAQVSGAVIVEILIDEEGNVASARAITGHPLLKDAAVAAARRWKFLPTELSGEPVQAIGTITFKFSLPSSSEETSRMIRKSGGVLQGSAIKRVQPSYPQAAKEAGVSGAVIVEVVIDEAGFVTSARAVSGDAMLIDAAVEAAQQWEFTPTALKGEPVRVIGTITFMFSL